MSKRIENIDEMSDPANPLTIRFEDIAAAAARLKPHIPYTPCIPSHRSKQFTMNLMYKMECVLPSGSFKERAALNALLQLPRDKKKTGLVLGSLGNHSLSLCHHAARMNIPVTAVFPDFVSMQKQERIRALGAKVLVQGTTIQEAIKIARAMAKEKGWLYISGRDHPHILAGNGTIALEIVEQVPNVDAVLVPVGTGGLISAIGIAIKRLKPNCLVYGVQPELMPVFVKALEAGEPVIIPEVNTIADCLQMTKAGINAFHNAKAVVDKMVRKIRRSELHCAPIFVNMTPRFQLLVKEDWIARAMLHLIEQERFVVEGAGACPLAAILGSLVPELKTKNVVCVVTGGNIDSIFLGRILDRGLAAEGRLIKFKQQEALHAAVAEKLYCTRSGGEFSFESFRDKVRIMDSSESLAKLMQLFADLGFNCLRYFRDHVWVEQDVYHVEMRIVLEGRNMEHALELKRTLDKAYPGKTTYDTEPFNDKSLCPCYVSKAKA